MRVPLTLSVASVSIKSAPDLSPCRLWCHGLLEDL